MRLALQMCILMLGSYCLVFAQENTGEDSVFTENKITQDWTPLIEEILENSESEEIAEKWQETLSELAENPIALNTATKESLESIPFLTESQVEALSYYIYRYGPLLSLSELLLVEEMDDQTLRWLKPFVCLGKSTTFPIEMPTLKKALKYGKQEIRLSAGRSVQEKLGYANVSDSVQNGKSYSGDPFHLFLRYGFNYKEKMQWGLALEKDAGEKIWDKKNKGIDYVSFHFLLKDQKRIKTLIIGDYNVKFGQGLVCASSFSLGKNVAGVAPEQTGTNLSRHFSASESGFFRGIGATFVLKPYVWKNSETKGKFGLNLTTFASLRNLDAKIINNSFPSVSLSELHRTKAESDIKDKLGMYTLGMHFALRTDFCQFGLTGIGYRLNASINPEWKPYNCYYFRGKQGGNISMDYRLRFHGIQFFGELALDEKFEKAFITGLMLKPYANLDFSFLARNYAPEYNAYFANAFSEGTLTKNEQGAFVSIEWRLVKNLRVNAYYDVFVFPWLKYGVNAPSTGTDYVLQSTWTLSPKSQMIVRFKSKVKEKNVSNEENTFSSIESQLKNQFRIQINSTNGLWNIKTVLDGNETGYKTKGNKPIGFAASQEVTYVPKSGGFGFSMRYALFDTETFDNRIYSYERDLPGVFSMTSLYGKGSRFSLLFHYNYSKAISMQVKIGHSFYRDRQNVGTALEQVQGNQLTDIRALFLWKF